MQVVLNAWILHRLKQYCFTCPEQTKSGKNIGLDFGHLGELLLASGENNLLGCLISYINCKDLNSSKYRFLIFFIAFIVPDNFF